MTEEIFRLDASTSRSTPSGDFTGNMNRSILVHPDTLEFTNMEMFDACPTKCISVNNNGLHPKSAYGKSLLHL